MYCIYVYAELTPPNPCSHNITIYTHMLFCAVDRLEERYEELLREKKELHDKNIGVSSTTAMCSYTLYVHVLPLQCVMYAQTLPTKASKYFREN